MIAEFYFDVIDVAQILGAAQQHQLCLSGIYFEPISSEPDVEGCQNMFHVSDDILNLGFFFATD